VFGLKPGAAREVVIDVAPPEGPTGTVFAGISLLAVREVPLPGSYLIDFNTLAGPAYPAGETWNTVNSLTDATPYALVTASGDGSAGYTLTLIDGFDQFRSETQGVPGGFSSEPERTLFALRDDVPLTAQMTFGGLETNLTYDFTFLARRGSIVGGFDYSGTYTFTGAGTPVVKVVDGAANLTYADALGISPDSSSNITLAITAGPGAGTDFPVLNLIRMIPSGNAGSAGLAGLFDDPEGDDIVNLGEYGKNLNPLVVDANPFFIENLGLESNPKTLVGTYDWFKPAFEATYSVETTTNLASPNWQVDPAVNQSVISDSGSSQSLRISRPVDGSQLFLRLGLEWAP
jgi:hypothetical protein